jgi:hypothetical protein
MPALGAANPGRLLTGGPGAAWRGVAAIGPGARPSWRPAFGAIPAVARVGRTDGWAIGWAEPSVCGDTNLVLRATGRELVIVEAGTTVMTRRLMKLLLITA